MSIIISSPIDEKNNWWCKSLNEILYIELTSKILVNKVIETKIEDKNFIEFVELFLNDYITDY